MRGGLVRAAALLAQPRYEVFPSGSVEQAVADWVPPGMTVTVTASPARGLDATLDLTERLVARGYRVVPHLSARLVVDDAHLTAIVARLAENGPLLALMPSSRSTISRLVSECTSRSAQAGRTNLSK